MFVEKIGIIVKRLVRLKSMKIEFLNNDDNIVEGGENPVFRYELEETERKSFELFLDFG